MWYREIVFCVVTFGNRIVLRRLFLLLEEPSMSVIHLMIEKSGNMANCPIKFHSHAFEVETLSGIAMKIVCLKLMNYAGFSFLQIKDALSTLTFVSLEIYLVLNCYD